MLYVPHNKMEWPDARFLSKQHKPMKKKKKMNLSVVQKYLINNIYSTDQKQTKQKNCSGHWHRVVDLFCFVFVKMPAIA